MNKKNILTILTFAVILALFSNVSAVPQKDIAYIIKDNSQINGNIIVALNELNLSYDIIRDSQIPKTDFNKYYVLLIPEDLNNKNLLPFESKHAIFFDRRIAETVWQGSASSFTTNARQIKVTDLKHQIFAGITIPVDGIINIYTSSAGSSIHYLSKKPSYVTNLAIRTNENKPVLAYSIRNIGGYPVRDVFFGAANPSDWNTNAQTIFKNSLLFLRADVDQDGDGWPFELDCNDNNNLIYPGAPEIPYDGIDQNCDGYDLLDFDGDGFCKQGTIIQNSILQCHFERGLIGTDCNDNDPEINPNHQNKSLNCVNDPPEFTYLPANLQFNEGETVTFYVEASDPEEDTLTYYIDHPGFIVNGNTFRWQTGYTDAGTHLLKVAVTDGEFHTHETILLTIIDRNAPPILIHNIQDIVWPEDTIASINLSDYFIDIDSPEIYFGIETYPNESRIEVEFEGNEIIVFIPAENFFGEETILFFAEDGESKTLSNEVKLIVTNVNDPVVFEGEIPDIEFNEDQPLLNALNLYNYFSDPDFDSLDFKAIGAQNITIQIINGWVSFYPDKDFSGIEQFYFEATDGEFFAESNLITITVHEQGEPPEFYPLECETTILEDVEYSCPLKAWDFEGDPFYFSIASQENMSCIIEDNILIYKSSQDYFGTGSCLIQVSDNTHGASQELLQFEILPVNDAPRISSYTPTIETIHIIEGRNKTFSISAYDIDSPQIFTSWLLMSQEVKNSTENSSFYTLVNPPIGNYLIEAIVRDEALQTRKSWNIIVGPITDFTCSEVGGSICSKGTMCGAETFSVKDTASCCLAECVPSFKDANSCKQINEKVRIEFKNFPTEVELGDKIKVEFLLTNNLAESHNFDIEAHLYNLDSDISEAVVKTSTTLGSSKSRTMNLELEVPKDIDPEDKFAVLVVAEDYECGQKYEKIKINRQKDSLSITDFVLPKIAMCGDSVDAEVSVENIGTHAQTVELTVSNSDLKISETFSFNLDEYSKADYREVRKFSLAIPKDTETGEYKITARVDYSDSKFETLVKTIKVECPKEQVFSTTTNAQPLISDKVILNQIKDIAPLQKAKKKNYLPIALVGTMNIILLSSALLLYMTFKKKKPTQSINKFLPNKKS